MDAGDATDARKLFDQFDANAQALARRALKEGGSTDAERIAFAFRCALTRPPSADESKALLDLLNKQRERLKDGKLNALEIAVGKGAKPESVPKELDVKEAAAYTITVTNEGVAYPAIKKSAWPATFRPVGSVPSSRNRRAVSISVLESTSKTGLVSG